MLSAIDRNHCPPSIGTGVRNHRNPQEREQRERKREQEDIDKKAERNRKEKEKAFERLIGLPREQHEARLAELAKRLDEDLAAAHNDFSVFVGMAGAAASTDSWNVEPWPEPVDTRLLLQAIIGKICRYIVLRPEAVTATALWTMTAWAHEGATHSPILAAISVEPDSGKSTLLGVLRFLVPKPFVSVEPTGRSVYRTVDRERPTLIIDEADDLFYRKSDLRAIVAKTQLEREYNSHNIHTLHIPKRPLLSKSQCSIMAISRSFFGRPNTKSWERVFDRIPCAARKV